MADDLVKALQKLGEWADAINVAKGGMARLTNVERDYITAKRKLDEAQGAAAEALKRRQEHENAADKAKDEYDEAKRKAQSTFEQAESRARDIVNLAAAQAKFKADSEYQSHQQDIARVAQQSQDKQAELLALTKAIEAKKQEHAEVHAALEAIKARFVT